MSKSILVVDDEESIRRTLMGILNDEGFRVLLAEGGRRCCEMVEEENPDLILLDIWMPDMDGIETLRIIKSINPSIPVIMISGHGTIESAVKAIKLGAYDFIEKPLSLEKVVLTINKALEHVRLEEENRLLKQKIERQLEIIGTSYVIQEIKEFIKIVAPTNTSVLITGESGTGKELVARAIHKESPRSMNPFVEVNCAAIPEELIESELFGHEKGSFTGAIQKRRGKFDLANGGTIFLDEIGDMSLKTQAKILRIIEEKKFERVGGSKPVEVDVRIIAATNKNLEEEIRKGNFREDLYYRLNVIPIHIKPLRERKEDIPVLVEYFLSKICSENGRDKKEITKDAIDILCNYNWPGNVRELRNLIERLVILTPGRIIRSSDIIGSLKGVTYRRYESAIDAKTYREARINFEKEFILQKLRENDWNISKTAEAIGLERSYLHKKIKLYNIEQYRDSKE